MLFRQFINEDLGCASYLIGDEKAGVAAVVDPGLAVDWYLDAASYRGVRIAHVLETHTHADHVSGHGALADAVGATIHIHEIAEARYPHESFADGWELRLGALVVRALHTPGHRPEHTSFVLTDTTRGPEPWAVLSGDSLFVGDVARTDLAVEASEGARAIFRSLHEHLLELPGECEVWPGHLGGSMCGGAGMDMKVCSTIGFERRNNPHLSIAGEDEFVASLLAEVGPQPANFTNIVGINSGPLASPGSRVDRLAVEDIDSHRASGALLVDVRSSLDFDAAHIPGSISLPAATPGFGSRVGWLAPAERGLIFIGASNEEVERAGRLAAAVGVVDVNTCLAGGLEAWRLAGRPLVAGDRMSVEELSVRLEGGSAPQILDVRDRNEWEAGHLPSATFIPWHDIDGIPDGIDPSLPIVTICAGGSRAGTAASMLEHHGATAVARVAVGGVGRLRDLGHELTASSPSSRGNPTAKSSRGEGPKDSPLQMR